tara:strand:+ start:1052 stop:2113 length:1062 start_codon:yes stop_codon:yes gene_type:complete
MAHNIVIKNKNDAFLYNIDNNIEYVEINNINELDLNKSYSNNKNKKTVYCGNCGKKGHIYKKCHFPVMSLGVICLKLNNININSIIKNNYKVNNICDPNIIEKYLDKNLKFLMIRRKHSLGYMEFIRGKYKLDDIDYLLNIVSLMSEEEINNIKTCNFDELWNKLWNIDKPNRNHRTEYENSLQKFNELRKGVIIKFQKKIKFRLDIYNIFDNIKSEWKEPEWGFPKGRRNLRESDLDCAIREFNEETDIKEDQHELINMNPITEKFIGTNGVRYQHTYYLSQINCDIELKINSNNLDQVSEVGDMKWFSYKEARQRIRNYNIEKKIKLDNIYYFIKLLLLNSNYNDNYFMDK